jgi:Nucleoside H+ symporter
MVRHTRRLSHDQSEIHRNASRSRVWYDRIGLHDLAFFCRINRRPVVRLRAISVLHLLGAVLLYFVTKATTFGSVYALMFIYCLCYFPTIALTNSLTLQHLKDTGRDFPLIRVFGTLGWIAIGVTIGRLGVETTTVPFLLAAGASVLMSIFSLTLPHTPPPSKGQSVTMRRILGLDALVMLKRPSFAVFAVASILACIPLTFYFSFTNAYLNELHVPNAAGKMALGQASAGLLFICASSTSITWERTASRPETGLLIPSVYNRYVRVARNSGAIGRRVD